MDDVFPHSASYWIGLTDYASEGTFRWVESHQTPSYTNWESGEPNNHDGNEDCAAKVWQTFHVGGWVDLSCDINANEIDEILALCQTPRQ